MKSRIKVKGALHLYLYALLYITILLAIVAVVIAFFPQYAGLLVGLSAIISFIMFLFLYIRKGNVIVDDLVSFATEYGQVQSKLLREMELPYALLDDSGKVIWSNRAFDDLTHKKLGSNRSIASIFPEASHDKLNGEEDYGEFPVSYENGEYLARFRRIALDGMIKHSDLVDSDDYEGYMTALYLFDETALRIALKENDDQSLAVALLYLDNYDEALESIEEVRRSLLTALIDGKINKYISSLDGISKKLEKDKFLVILRKKSVKQLQDSKFDILDVVKSVNIGNEMSVTISMGVGLDGLTYSQNYEFARAAIDLALGRGGDQAVVKTTDKITYYGGKSQQVEKNTRVKARVKAHALHEIITSKDRVLIMGHRLGDVDSFGASVGIARIAKTLDRKAHIVLNEVSASLKPMRDLYMKQDDFEEDMLVTPEQAVDLAGTGAVLVVVDVNKPSITECPELLKMCKSIVVLDHHRQGTESIENATLSYVEAYASSACEMVTEILQYISDGIKLKAEEADIMYSGMMLDTNNFMTKTGVRTFEAAAYLRRAGADVSRVRKLFRDDANAYKAKADTVSHAVIYRDMFAIAPCSPVQSVQSPTEIGAQAANDLLNIKGVKGSFVCTPYQDRVYISARSIDEVNVQVIMERMGGGGHMNMAGAQIEGVSVEEAMAQLKYTLDTMLDEGDI
ncbi:MAG: DHH family phosphoesterase [Lachnospiraceae bacterium]|nr:DHH family phosphoesterase [Lachnospiraceae bacterium]